MKTKLLISIFLGMFVFSCSSNKEAKKSTANSEKTAKTTKKTPKAVKKSTKKEVEKSKTTQNTPQKTAKKPPVKPAASSDLLSGIPAMVKKEMAKAHPKVKMETSMGTIILELDTKKAPITVKNFLTYVSKGFYNGTIFHRVIKNFMIQGGGFTTDHKKKTDGLIPPIKNEATNGLENNRGTIAMARTMNINSAQAQFFINVVDNKFLNHVNDTPRRYGYAVFGKVIKGMDVVDKIRNTPTENKGGPFRNAPVKDVVIKSVSILP